MSIIGRIILGLIAGFVASKIVNKSGEGFFLTLLSALSGRSSEASFFSLFGANGVTGFISTG